MKRDVSEADVRALRVQLEGEPDHPNLEEELFLYADGTLPPERHAAVDAHLATCARCREDVNDLLAVRTQPAREARRWPYAAAAAILAALIGAGSWFATREEAPAPRPIVVVKQPPAQPQRPAEVPVIITTTTEPPKAGYARREWDSLVRAARTGTRLVMPVVLQTLRPGSDHLRGRNDASYTLRPAGVVVETQRPTFTWRAREGARAVVSVFEGGREVVRSEPRTEPRWKPHRDLARGVTYTWEVELEKEGQVEILPSPPAPQARFRVLDEDARVELDAARREHANDHLLLGLLYAKNGLDEEAKQELQQVEDPRDADTARRLLRDIDTWDARQ